MPSLVFGAECGRRGRSEAALAAAAAGIQSGRYSHRRRRRRRQSPSSTTSSLRLLRGRAPRAMAWRLHAGVHVRGGADGCAVA